MPKLQYKPDQDVIKARGERIRTIREALGFSRNGFENFGIQMGTLQNWEDGRRSGLTTKGAHRLVDAFKAAGAHVTAEWLLQGTGADPIIAPKSIAGNTARTLLKEISGDSLTHDLLLKLHNYYHHIIDMLVPNNHFSPFIREGDCVAGFRYLAQDIDKALDRLCIVQLKQGEMRLGILTKDNYGLFQLQSSLENDKQASLAVDLHSAAPIIFILGQP